MDTIKIKICGITRESDLLALSHSGVDYAGLIFDEGSPRFAGGTLSPQSAREKKGGLKTVGVFVNADLDRIARMVEDYGLDLVQLHGDESPAFCQEVRRLVPVIRAIQIGEGTDPDGQVEPYLEVCDYFLFDSAGPRRGGNGKTFNWDLLKGYSFPIPFFLGGGIGPDHYESVTGFHHKSWAALDLNSRFEHSPGVKHLDAIRDFVNRIKRNENPETPIHQSNE